MDNMSKNQWRIWAAILDKLSNILMRMMIKNDELAFNAALCQRVKGIRESKEWTAEEMAVALGIPVHRYRKYESRSPIPHYLIPRIALIAGRSVEWVLTGKDRKGGAGSAANAPESQRA